MAMIRPSGMRVSGVGAALLLCSSAALAQDAHKGMPQLEFGNPLLISQVVWGAIIFLVFYLALSRWALPRVGAVIDHRHSVIETDLETARQSKTEADAAVAALNAERRRASAASAAAIADATQKAKQAVAESMQAVNARLDAQLATAEQQISEARARAMGALRQVATETAEMVVSRLTQQPADRSRVDEAVNFVLAERAGSL